MKAAVAQVIKYTAFLEFKTMLSRNVLKHISVFSTLMKNVSCQPFFCLSFLTTHKNRDTAGAVCSVLFLSTNTSSFFLFASFKQRKREFGVTPALIYKLSLILMRSTSFKLLNIVLLLQSKAVIRFQL